MGVREKVLTPKVEKIVIEGEEVEIRTLNAAARAALEDGLKTDKDGKADTLDLVARVVVFATYNLDGTAVFKLDDVELLKTQANGNDVADIFSVASRLNGLDRAAQAKN